MCAISTHIKLNWPLSADNFFSSLFCLFRVLVRVLWKSFSVYKLETPFSRRTFIHLMDWLVWATRSKALSLCARENRVCHFETTPDQQIDIPPTQKSPTIDFFLLLFGFNSSFYNQMVFSFVIKANLQNDIFIKVDEPLHRQWIHQQNSYVTIRNFLLFWRNRGKQTSFEQCLRLLHRNTKEFHYCALNDFFSFP